MWGLPHCRRRAVSCGRPPDGQTAHGLRQDQVHRGGAEGKKKHLTTEAVPADVEAHVLETAFNSFAACV